MELSEKEGAASQLFTSDEFSIRLNELTDVARRGICF